MVLLFNVNKCCKSLYSAALKLHHTSSISLKWPIILKESENLRKNESKMKLNKPIKVWEKMTIWDLAKAMKQNLDYVEQIIKPKLGNNIEPLTGIINNFDAIKQLLEDQNVDYSIIQSPITKENQLIKKIKTIKSVEQNVKNLVKRPPIVTIMGHVDHGKTTLLDSLRNSNIVSKEFGGITQHIGAFSVMMETGQSITFIDTPGHAAFTSMRSRGAEVTDIIILIVAADDGVMEQTVESIRMAKSANVRVIVAVNKIDKGGTNLEEIKQQLLLEGVQAEDLGGDVQVIPISALKKMNLDLLIEALLLEAEIMNLTGDPSAPVEGIVIESNVGPRGKVATVIVKQGTLRKSAILTAGLAKAKVREMYNENNCKLSEVTLSQPAQITGWRELPAAGDKVVEVKSENEARAIIKDMKKKAMQKKMEEDYSEIQKKSVQHSAEYNERRRTLIELKKKGDIAGLKEMFLKKEVLHNREIELNIIVKGDVDGSVEAILDVFSTYKHDDECKLNLVNSGVGVVTRSDIDLASTFNAIIYCFNLEFPKNLKDEILAKNIKVRFHNIIYNLIDDIKQEINALLPPKDVENILGEAEVIQNFFITEQKKKIPVAGCSCSSGELKKDCLFRVIRKDSIIFEGKVKSLKHHKTEVNSIKKGVQCGIMFNDFANEFHPNDKIICYEINQINFPTSWNPGF